MTCSKQEDIRPCLTLPDNQLKILSLQQKNENLAELFKR